MQKNLPATQRNQPKKISPKRLTHPLYGSNLGTLIKLLSRNGPIPQKHWPQVGLALGSATLRWPFAQIERLYMLWALADLKMKAPIFIVGHWRSGTTHLCNILSKSPQFGYVSPVATGLPWELMTLGQIFKPLLEKGIPRNRLIDRVPVTPDAPQEDEFGLANMLPFSFLHALYFPQEFKRNARAGLYFEGLGKRETRLWQRKFMTFLKKVYLDQGQKQLLIRNPVYTTRMAMIKELIPEAKFIHIYRNPYQVFVSMQNYYRKLLPALAWQSYTHVDIDTFIIRTYVKMMGKYDHDASKMNSQDLIEVSYEELDKNPTGVIQQIYDQLQLPDFELNSHFFQNYLKTIRSYQKNQYTYDEATVQLVQQHWNIYLERWGYEPV